METSLAEASFRAQDFQGCVSQCRAALAYQPDQVASAHLLGVALLRGGNPRDGIKILLRGLAAFPAELRLRMDCALAIAGSGDVERAIALLAEGARYHPGDPDLAARLARLLSDHGRHGDSQLVLRTALRLQPFHLELRGQLVAELAADLACGSALTELRKLQILLPAQSPLFGNEGVMRQSLGQLDAAIAAYRRAIQLDPANHVSQVNLGTALLTRGDYDEGWRRYEHRRFLPDMRHPPAGLPAWTAGGKRVLLSAEQGFGDLLQFVRFLPLVKNVEIWLDCPPEMKRLMAGLAGVAGVVSPGDPTPPFDGAAPLLSLPFLLGVGADLRSDSIPYIYRVSPGPVLPPDPRLKIGLVWSGRPAKGELFIRRTLARRSCPVGELAPLWKNEAYRWYSLQLGAPCPPELTDLAPLIADFADSAALIDQLDLVISIDSAVAHLTAAMGKPLWLLLAPGQCDYRWNGVAGGSPWYPKARLFRAGTGGWPALAAEVAESLKEEFSS